MKILKLSVIAVFFSCLTYSCSSDDSSESGGGDSELANQQNQQEESSVALATIETGVDVVGATKNTGAPPQPNSNINLTVASSQFEAVQSAGFNLRFSTTETTVAGAYLQFTDSDNNATSSYFDIPVSSFEQAKRTKAKQTSRGVFSKNNAFVDGDYQIDIDFDNTFPPGKFCGVLCIYDSANNISQPITVCVEVEAWGGNASLVGTWIESDDNDNDDTTSVTCNNNEQINVSYDETVRQDSEITLSANGDFEILNDEEYRTIDYTASAEVCSAVYSEEVFKDKYRETGKWAFNEDNQTLSVVGFAIVDLLDPSESEEFPEGELLLQSAKVQLNGNTLILTETYTEEGETYTEVITLVRK